MRWLAIAVLAAGCDRVWFIDHIASPDATITATGDADASVDGPVPLVGCPSYFTYMPATGTWYWYGEDAVSWAFARDACRARTAIGTTNAFVHLAVITTQTEYTLARGLSGTSAWIGIFNDTPSNTTAHYRAVTHESLPVTLPWDSANGLPDNPDSQYCARPFMSGGLDDDFCYASQTYVCECDTYIDDGT